jgi:uncharacterized membrane protein YcjF (UPF0283 family)
MKLALVLFGVAVGVVAVYLLAAWAQRRGWVNFKATGSGMTAGLAEAGRVLDPPTKHIQSVREETPHREADGDPSALTPPAAFAPR